MSWGTLNLLLFSTAGILRSLPGAAFPHVLHFHATLWEQQPGCSKTSEKGILYLCKDFERVH